MLFNERQVKIIEKATQFLIKEIGLTQEQSMKLIAEGINNELAKRETTMEKIVNSHRSVQISFVQDVTREIHRRIAGKTSHSAVELTQIVERFKRILDEIWAFN